MLGSCDYKAFAMANAKVQFPIAQLNSATVPLMSILLQFDTSNDFSIALMVGVGASSVTLAKDNTKLNSGVIDASDRAAVTLSGNLVIQREKFQIAFSRGIDNRIDGNSEDWAYQGWGWMSVGIGISIFNNGE